MCSIIAGTIAETIVAMVDIHHSFAVKAHPEKPCFSAEATFPGPWSAGVFHMNGGFSPGVYLAWGRDPEPAPVSDTAPKTSVS